MIGLHGIEYAILSDDGLKVLSSRFHQFPLEEGRTKIVYRLTKRREGVLGRTHTGRYANDIRQFPELFHSPHLNPGAAARVRVRGAQESFALSVPLQSSRAMGVDRITAPHQQMEQVNDQPIAR